MTEKINTPRDHDRLSEQVSADLSRLALDTMRKLSAIMVRAEALYPDAPETAINRVLIAFLFAILRYHLDAYETISRMKRYR